MVKTVDTAVTQTILKPSRFNVITEDEGSLRLYNSYRGKIAVFDGDQARVKRLLRTKTVELSKNDKKNSEIITFLFQKGFFVRESVDEFQLATAQKYNLLSFKRTLELILMPNEDCNFRCLYCYEDFVKSEMKETVQKGILKFLEKTLRRYNSLVINWFGGEPLKSFNVIKKMSPQIMEICKKYNVHYRAGMTTNGYLLDKDKFEQLVEYEVRSFQITLDGTAETHDRYREGRFGEKTVDTILSNLIQMKHSPENFHVIIRSNINDEVATTMNQYISLMGKLFAEDSRFTLHFHPIKNLKREQTSDIYLCDKKELFAFYDKAKEEGFNFDYYKRSLYPGGSECYASNPSSLVIGSDGMIYKCTVAFNNPYNHVGDILENGDVVIDQEKWILWTTGGVNEDPACTKCFFRPSCQGNACPLKRIESGITPCPSIKKNVKKYIKLVSGDYSFNAST
ncbi:SPASM domain-containing protein [Paenibacillus melissococcoides]|uniref:SPASM domain-containing protein n=1 Tax=Paenibacillus melissococcoides TaxID=2912268 RepID=A0ABM9G5G2_9BACL|nr:MULTISPECIES: radical SAM protein [Paenibacillus]MEB9892723.1 radical SAM protein [Bacillus cereus]CAH8247020.1 SPASM domain-containing protein [Paenibacillus melissococcoides]CAH8716504.1 SPASM domain-containing protein [Paenibacillus melissococcoides]CAH8717483.1 SPASM domain-containing protein [Paenibacillus melissococcoides]GIO76566.1 radical SAM/SPASM domain-containing protein [Paenibacillus dendritiformis]